MKKLFLYWLSVLLCFSCAKTEESLENAPISEVPKITIESISPGEIDQFESLHIEIGYTDGDGDVGDENADEHSLEITDMRDNILHTFHIPPQSPVTGIVISGVLAVEIENVILLDQSNTSEEITFNVKLKDAAGNWSNTESSDAITVKR